MVILLVVLVLLIMVELSVVIKYTDVFSTEHDNCKISVAFGSLNCVSLALIKVTVASDSVSLVLSGIQRSVDSAEIKIDAYLLFSLI